MGAHESLCACAPTLLQAPGRASIFQVPLLSLALLPRRGPHRPTLGCCGDEIRGLASARLEFGMVGDISLVASITY